MEMEDITKSSKLSTKIWMKNSLLVKRSTCLITTKTSMESLSKSLNNLFLKLRTKSKVESKFYLYLNFAWWPESLMILMNSKERKSVSKLFLTQEPKRMKSWMSSGKFKKLKILTDLSKLDSNSTGDFITLELKLFQSQELL